MVRSYVFFFCLVLAIVAVSVGARIAPWKHFEPARVPAGMEDGDPQFERPENREVSHSVSQSTELVIEGSTEQEAAPNIVQPLVIEPVIESSD